MFACRPAPFTPWLRRAVAFAVVAVAPWVAAAPGASPPPPSTGTSTSGVALMPVLNVRNVPMQPGTATIAVSNLFTEVPMHGYVPLHVTIKNLAEKEGTWVLRTSNKSYLFRGGVGAYYDTEVSITLAGHAAKTIEVLAPLPDFDPRGPRNLALYVTGPGVENNSPAPSLVWTTNVNMRQPPPSPASTRRGAPGGAPSPPTRRGQADWQPRPLVFAGISPTINRDFGYALLDYHSGVAYQQYLQTALDPALLPTDWRGFLGLNVLVYSASDWLDVPAETRAAILQWVAAGGQLRVITNQPGGLGLPPHPDNRYGAGTLYLFSEEEAANFNFKVSHLDAYERLPFNFYCWPPPSLALPLLAGKSPPIFESAVPVLKDNYALVAFVIILFGLLVGPVNLFLLCGGPRRARTLWVTPLLSAGASVVLLGFILYRDGVGGQGVYYRVTQWQADGRFEVDTQVNTLLTGLLLHRDFQLAEPAWMVAFDGPNNQSLKTGQFGSDGVRYWGDWLTSRQTQTQRAQTVISSRSALRLVAAPAGTTGKPPSVHLEYTGALENLFYIDADGHAWKTARLTQGQTVALTPATLEEVANAWLDHQMAAPTLLSGQLDQLAPRPGTFFATGDSPNLGLEPRGPSLHWTAFHHLVTGSVTE